MVESDSRAKRVRGGAALVGGLRALAGLAAVLTALAALHVSCAGPAEGPEAVAGNPTAEPGRADGEEAEGEDFVVFLTGHWQGQLEPCGCSEEQLGGIDRRTHLLAAPGERRLLVDAGPVLVEMDRQAELKLSTFLLSMKELGYDAVMLTGPELEMLREKVGLERSRRPEIVATNLAAEQREAFGAVEAVEKTLTAGGERLEALVLGVWPEGEEIGELRGGVSGWGNPIAAVRGALERRGIDPDGATERLVVVASPARDVDLAQALASIAAVDVVMTTGVLDEPELERVDGGLVLTTGNLGKYISRMDLEAEAGGDLRAAGLRTVAVKDIYPLDPRISAIIESYQVQLEVEDLIAEPGALPRRPLPAGLEFVGNESCGTRDCHPDIYQKWNTFGHGHAMETLERVGRDYNPECVVCHVVGMEYEGGYRSMAETPELGDVGCEACHGPGSGHLEDPWAEYQMVWVKCEDCHTHENSPPFAEQREEYFEKVRHWIGERRYWE